MTRTTGPRILVTGGAGFVGSHLVELLAQGHAHVGVVDDLSRGRREWVAAGLPVYEVDLRDEESLRAAVDDFRPDAVAHLAALHFIPAVDGAPEVAWSINVEGTRSLLLALSRRPPERLVFASTAAVYPDSASPLREDVPPAPLDLYGRTKLESERDVTLFSKEYGTSCVSARLFNVVGPRETNPHVVPEIVGQLRDGADSLTLGNVAPERDFVDVRDVAAALADLLLLRRPGLPPALNVGSGRSTSVADLVAVCARLLGRDVQIRQAAERARAVDRLRLVADVRLIREWCGWRPRRTLESALAELLGVDGPRSGERRGKAVAS